MVTLTEPRHAGGFMVSEANGFRSRDQVTFGAGTGVVGQVLGKITASGRYVALDLDAEDGSEAAAAIAWDTFDATAAPVDGAAVTRDAEVRAVDLTWPAGITAPAKAAAVAELAEAGIIVRD